jgi:DNA-binding GntR family transcriptional regulator
MHMSGNEFVVAQMPILRLTAQVFAPVAVVERDAAVRAVGEHAAIVAAIEAGDGPEAERMSRRHIERTMDQIRAGA